jgi:hypothetical protein
LIGGVVARQVLFRRGELDVVLTFKKTELARAPNEVGGCGMMLHRWRVLSECG